MKKLTALVLVLMMALSVAAMAEQPTIETVNWDDVTATEGIDMLVANGQFYGLETLGLKIWIPNGLTQVESVTPYLFSDEEGTSGVSVFIEDAPEGLDPMDPEALYAYIKDIVGGMEAAPSVVNGIFAVAYKLGDEAEPQICLTYGANGGKLIHFVLEGVDMSNQIETAGAMLIMASISEI